MSKKKEKKKGRRRKKKRKFSFPLFFLFLFLIAGLGYYILTLPIWGIKDVVVNGTKMLSDDEIRAMAAIPLSENLFFANFSRASKNLSNITPIKNFRLYRIPPGTVLISIEERQPIATIVFAKKSIIIDEQGFVLNRNPKISLTVANMADLPVVSGINEKDVLKDDHVDAEIAGLISDIISKLSRYLESSRIQLELGGLKNVSFLLDDILQVKVGSSEQVKRKMEVFGALLPVISGKWPQVAYVDVRYPDNPVIRYK
ncbi:MAG: FtsQ-type POTRA domain-containing protein [Candidatus Margulisbacteria bacterium]|nr:FtsQ-type POTRA domain-containing protein [Candidatus Margulisiibacteriota bacterium]